jgi:hypothetical protein
MHRTEILPRLSQDLQSHEADRANSSYSPLYTIPPTIRPFTTSIPRKQFGNVVLGGLCGIYSFLSC